MLKSKFFLLFLYFSMNFAARVQKQNLEPYSRFKSIHCNSSNITVSGYKCYIKAFSRTNTTTNIFVNLTRPVHSFNVRYDLRFKSLSNSQRSIINTTLEVCSILNGTGSNPVYKWFIGMMPELEELLHPCPYKVGFLGYSKQLEVDINYVLNSKFFGSSVAKREKEVVEYATDTLVMPLRPRVYWKRNCK
ncbi:unnamed protein product [Chironomus riparius]|uniref:Uncharacterized protein n=1 Tax=Chironomus riparius TaxID=315576 RepID=A0A9P0JBI0_9DIPT|nr:unnamed protein product [Chironomus riparius]